MCDLVALPYARPAEGAGDAEDLFDEQYCEQRQLYCVDRSDDIVSSAERFRVVSKSSRAQMEVDREVS